MSTDIDNVVSDILGDIRNGIEPEEAVIQSLMLVQDADAIIEEVLSRCNLTLNNKKDQILSAAGLRKQAIDLGFPILSRKKQKPVFPLGALPPPLRDYCAAVASTAQVAPEMTGPMALGVLSTASLRKFVVSEMDGHINPLCLYLLVCAPSGERKSSTLAAFTDVLTRYEEEFNRDNAACIEETRLLEMRLTHLSEVAVKKESFISEYLRVKAEYAHQERIHALRLFADDATPEALTQYLATNQERGAIIAAEGGVLDVLAGRYAQKLNVDLLLHAHCAERHSVDRITRPTEVLERPELAILLAVQPDVLTTFVNNQSFAGRGLLARFLFALPDSRIGSRTYQCDAVAPEIKSAYDLSIRRLLALPVPSQPQRLQLTDEANQALAAYFAASEQRLVADPNREVNGAAKHVGTVIRLAGLLHVVEDPAGEREITLAELLRAIELGEYFRASANLIWGDSASEVINPDAAYLLHLLRRKQKTSWSKSDLIQATRGHFQSVAALNAALTSLAEMNYIRIKTSATNSAGRPTETVILNPMMFEFFN